MDSPSILEKKEPKEKGKKGKKTREKKEKKTREKKEKEPKGKTIKRRDYTKITKKESDILETRRKCIQTFREKL